MLTTVAALLLAAVPLGRPNPQALETFGRDLAADFGQGKDGLAARLDLGALLDRTLAPMSAPADFKRGFRGGALKSGYPVGKGLLTFLGPKGRLAFRRIQRVGDTDAVLLRAISEGGAFNYFQLLVARDGQGALRVVDMYSLSTGNLVSEDLRQIALMGLAESQQGLLDRLAGKERLLLSNAKVLKRMGEAQVAGRHAEAWQAWSELPRDLREDRIFLRQSVSVASNLDEAQYRRQLDRYLELFPQDPAAQVMAIDACFLRQDWACADQAIAGVERWLGAPDGWLLVLHGTVATSAGRRADARAAYRKAIEVEPALMEAYTNLLDLVMADKDWKATADLLVRLERDAGAELTDLGTVEGFRPFLASAEGKAYLRRRAGSK
jgi:tetratricopeptide (TPR) repeat protein